MKPHSDISDPRIIKALTHPLRVSILGTLEERTASPSELAEELGAPLGNAPTGSAILVAVTPSVVTDHTSPRSLPYTISFGPAK